MDTQNADIPQPRHEIDGSWQRREPPLPAVAVVGVGAVAASLAVATHQRLQDGAELRAVADPEYLVVVLPEQILVSAMPVQPADPDALAKVFGAVPCE